MPLPFLQLLQAIVETTQAKAINIASVSIKVLQATHSAIFVFSQSPLSSQLHLMIRVYNVFSQTASLVSRDPDSLEFQRVKSQICSLVLKDFQEIRNRDKLNETLIQLQDLSVASLGDLVCFLSAPQEKELLMDLLKESFVIFEERQRFTEEGLYLWRQIFSLTSQLELKIDPIVEQLLNAMQEDAGMACNRRAIQCLSVLASQINGEDLDQMIEKIFELLKVKDDGMIEASLEAISQLVRAPQVKFKKWVEVCIEAWSYFAEKIGRCLSKKGRLFSFDQDDSLYINLFFQLAKVMLGLVEAAQRGQWKSKIKLEQFIDFTCSVFNSIERVPIQGICTIAQLFWSITRVYPFEALSILQRESVTLETLQRRVSETLGEEKEQMKRGRSEGRKSKQIRELEDIQVKLQSLFERIL